MTSSDIHENVRAYYREAARTGAKELAADGRWGASRYDDDTLARVPSAAADLSMGCGNPHAVVDLQPGETVLDLGSGAGLDVILSARRVGPTGRAYGIDFLDEMLHIARANAAEAGVTNAQFLHGMIENIPLADESVDVVISNCVINLAPDKVPVFAEIARVLRPGGRVAIFDVVAEDGLDRVTDASTDGNQWANCGAGALHHSAYLRVLAAAGLVEPSIQYTHNTGPGRHGAIVRARRP
ncbi:methyltransferase domain-containing protein [Mycobacterium decipiens]|uniref:Arsenite methyltransferase n=1 Tax=Mycobacterium decipiens TaxID=1430326 RepID=A0A1X2LUB1_9MYCO|nr:methyltransferase domain-containing protein [Mycobacterium decipiens]OSC40538.1 hypothetical protein B8W66_12695 [Mycobacterium decipiens]